ncbi:MAG: cation:proton antiporter [Vicinamibacteria bacterium]|nr:cation:proton antiporter [Vicinamibacteria bacterium]
MIERHGSVIVRKIVQLMNPMIRLYALYVLFHGHYSAGGGFQAGVLLGASFILTILSSGDDALPRFTHTTALGVACVGLMIYLGIGAIAVLKGGYFLDYGYLPLAGVESARRSLGILGVEIGICIAVMAVILSIFYSLVVEE